MIIRDLRKKRHMTQQELADKCEVTRQYVVMIERGQVNPSIKLLKKISTVLDVDIHYLLDNIIYCDIK